MGRPPNLTLKLLRSMTGAKFADREALLVPELLRLQPSCRLYIPVVIIPNKTEPKRRAHEYECTDECKRFCGR